MVALAFWVVITVVALLTLGQVAVGSTPLVNALIFIAILSVPGVVLTVALIVGDVLARSLERKWRATLSPGSYGALFYLAVPSPASKGQVVVGEVRLEPEGLVSRTNQRSERLTPWSDVSEVEVRAIGKRLARFPVLVWRETAQRHISRLWDATGPELSEGQLRELANEFVRRGAGGSTRHPTAS